MRPSGIVISDYDPRWPALFDEVRAQLQQAVGRWVVGIEHIGSTSVPGLAAKPVIGVLALADADAHCIEPIVALGYEYIQRYEIDLPERRFFRRRDGEGAGRCNIHLVEKGSEFWERHLLFRDYLRAHPQVARQYEQLKRRLAPLFDDVNQYADAKSDFIREIAKQAQRWWSGGDA